MIYTSYFGNMKKFKTLHPNMCFVSIAAKTPDWFFDYKNCYSYKLLAPKWKWWKEWHDKFIDDLECEESKKFYADNYHSTVLGMLVADEVANELNRIAKGNDVCLLCYETPKKFCHRHIVAEWLNVNNIECKELTC